LENIFNADTPISILPNKNPVTVIVANTVAEKPIRINAIVMTPTNSNETKGVSNLFIFNINIFGTLRSLAMTDNSCGKINNIAFKDVNIANNPPIAMTCTAHSGKKKGRRHRKRRTKPKKQFNWNYVFGNLGASLLKNRTKNKMHHTP